MFRMVRSVAVALPFLTLLLANDPDRDFSGKWTLDARSSKGQQQETTLSCIQQESLLKCTATRPDGISGEWSYDLNGHDTRYSFGDEQRSSKVKWEGPALIVNTIVSGTRDYSTVDRWTLSRDLNTLTIGREIVQNGADNEETLVYRREGTAPAIAQPAPAPPTAFTNYPNPSAQPPVLQPPPPPAGPADLVIHSGTRIPLSLRNAIDTKHSHEGDRVYLTTIYPVVVDNKVVIPKGSYVNGTLTTSKPAGAVGKKGELYIRFDSLTLPNGVTRDFRSRLASKDSGRGTVDKEGTITGERDNSNTARTTAETTGIGAGIGGLAGAAAGHPITGLGIGAAAGAAVGLATMLNKHKPDVVLPRGTVVEMLLDRDLTYQPSELGR
jgi:type IV secretion system protein VirB10